jgi:hypothetical protein
LIFRIAASAQSIFVAGKARNAPHLPKISVKSERAKAIHNALTGTEWPGLYLDRGFLEIDNVCAERATKTIANGRKNYMIVGSESGVKSAAFTHTLID